MNELKQALPDIVLERDCVRFDGTGAEIERYYAIGEPTTLGNWIIVTIRNKSLLIRAFWMH